MHYTELHLYIFVYSVELVGNACHCLQPKIQFGLAFSGLFSGMDYYPCDPDFFTTGDDMGSCTGPYWLVVWNIFYDFPNSWDMLG